MIQGNGATAGLGSLKAPDRSQPKTVAPEPITAKVDMVGINGCGLVNQRVGLVGSTCQQLAGGHENMNATVK